ncbi:ATP synthase F1 subunit delta [Acidicapsa acidisoli]|uniref:ATP synthase F1 subunit delta n=1 Tax=Acidicapsa acidisoli TaxID=1615681 RepID=UPI0021E04EB4|nr:ATP synthase F1 subunit delta [Acidicapsa acidisoli]
MAAFVSRYAQAFADVVAQFHLGADSVDQQLRDFLAAWDASGDLREVFEDPSVPAVQKIAVLDGMKSKLGLAPQVRNLLAVLIDHDRIGAVHEVVAEYHAELQRRLGVHQAEVTTARELNAEDKAALLAHVAELTQGRVDATFKLDPSILGGVVVRIGSKVYDGSVLGRVERLKEELAS